MPALNFAILDVFTTTRYLGNPLAVVHVPSGIELSPDARQKIAAEFNLSETVFVQDSDDSQRFEDRQVRLNIHTPYLEIPFAGHPTIGAGFRVLSGVGAPNANRTTTLLTRAGKIPVAHSTETGLTRLEVPHAFIFHGSLSRETIGEAIGLSNEDSHKYIISNALDNTDGVAMVSVVQGMPFALVHIASVEALAKTKGTRVIPASSFGSEGKPASIYLYSETILPAEEEIGPNIVVAIRSRMYWRGTLEDPATGSGASCLAGFLSMAKAAASGGVVEYHITQGVEMGRRSEIQVEVQTKRVGDRAEVEAMWLSGRCVQVMEGTLTV